MKRFFLAVVIGLFCIISQPFAEQLYPALAGHVVDEANVLTPQTKSELESLLSADTDNQIVVAVLNDLRGKDGREYGVNLARHWQLGQKGKDNGVLILLALKDRYASIEVGYGLESILTDSLSGRILQYEILPPIQKHNDYNQAMLNGAKAVMAVVSDGKIQTSDNDDDMADALIIALFLLLMFYGMSKGRGGGIFPGGFGGGGFGGFSGRGGGFFGGGGSFGGGGAGRRF